MKQDEIDFDDPQVREMDRLLRSYATNVFDSAEDDSVDVSDELIETLMRKTRFMRRFGTWSPHLTAWKFSAAAMLMICCGLFATFVFRESGLRDDRDFTSPTVTRAGEYEVVVTSPHLATMSRKPDIVITGDPGTTYRISIKDMDGKLLVQAFEMKGGTTMPGAKCFVQPLADDEVYSIVIQRDGKTVNDVENSSFWFEAE